VVLVVLAVAHLRLGPSSSATTSITERVVPSSACQDRCASRPTTTTRLPLASDPAVQLVALAEGTAEIIAVKVAGAAPAVRQGQPVKVLGLVAQPWTMGDRAGVAFRAQRVEPAIPQAKAS
jgi:hypothetical protein